ncbi:MAG: hypothetical protein ACRDJB_09840 [Actinomycetota bacterium]
MNGFSMGVPARSSVPDSGGELTVVEPELAHLVAFVKQGRWSERSRRNSRRRKAGRATCARPWPAWTPPRHSARRPPNSKTKLAILTDWAHLSRNPVPQQRQLLRKLVPDRLTVTLHVTATRLWIDWAGDPVVAPIINGIAPALGDVMPDPTERRWWP